MGDFLRQFFTWWHGQTLSLRFFTWRRGVLVGRDEAENLYYRDKKDASKRWVVYRGIVDASKTPPEWHAWLHHMAEKPPSSLSRRAWQKPHLPNMTGTRDAWRPRGSLHRSAARPPATGDYEPWTPPAPRASGAKIK